MQDVYRRTGKVVPDGRRGIVDRAAYMSFLESQLERVTVCVLCYVCVLLDWHCKEHNNVAIGKVRD